MKSETSTSAVGWSLASYLVAESLESYRTDHIDGDNIEALSGPATELEEGLASGSRSPI
jgi:hypothetical protein